MNNREKQAARAEKKQQKIETGFMSSYFPGVSNIIIEMSYRQAGLGQSLLRTVNYFPGSYAFFEVDCLSKECVMGGFDFTRILNSMVRTRKSTSSGEIACAGGPVSGHSAIAYEVTINYI